MSVTPLSRRALIGGAAAALAGCSREPRSAPPLPGASWESIRQAARREGRVLMYGSTMGAGQVAEVAAAFRAATGLDFDFLPITGAAAMTRIKLEADVGIAPDVFDATAGWLRELGEAGLLIPLRDKPLPVWREPAAVWNVHPGYKIDDWRFVLSRLRVRQGHLGINRRLLGPIGLPQSWRDLAFNPKFRAGMVLLDPTRSIASSVEMLVQCYIGKAMRPRDMWGIFARQAPMLISVSRANVNAVAQGERAITFPPIDETAMNLVEAGAPVGNIYFPDAPIFAETADMGVIRAGRHPNAALVFVDWWLSRAGQRLMGRLLHQTSLRSDVASGVPPALRGRVVGAGVRGPVIVDSPIQNQMTLDLRASGLMKRLVDGSPAEAFERGWAEFLVGWERKHGGRQDPALAINMT